MCEDDQNTEKDSYSEKCGQHMKTHVGKYEEAMCLADNECAKYKA